MILSEVTVLKFIANWYIKFDSPRIKSCYLPFNNFNSPIFPVCFTARLWFSPFLCSSSYQSAPRSFLGFSSDRPLLRFRHNGDVGHCPSRSEKAFLAGKGTGLSFVVGSPLHLSKISMSRSPHKISQFQIKE